jgi:dihydropteroate synthase
VSSAPDLGGRSAGRPEGEPAAESRSSIALPRSRSIDFGDGPAVMGIINVTPDSFSDGGVHFERSRAIEAALVMVERGAAVIDVGGESTRPGAAPVSVAEELDRTIEVIRGIRSRCDVPISIDTMKAAVASQAIAAGADVVNDVTALRFDPAMAGVVRDAGVLLVLMHMRGEPRTMQQTIAFIDVVAEVGQELKAFADAAVESGITTGSLLVDPGIGFGKTFEQNLELLSAAARFRSIAPVVIGASRKAFIGRLTGRESGAARSAGSLAAAAAAANAGAAIVRTHDVPETVDFLKVYAAIRRVKSGA